MKQNAFVKLVEESKQKSININELKNYFLKYHEKQERTGQQLAWQYEQYAFPYQVKEPIDGDGTWFYLVSDTIDYNQIAIGIIKNGRQTNIQFTLFDQSTFGDKNKAVEYCKQFGKDYKGEVHLFNGRTMYYYPRTIA